ncbi:MAG: hypothetical protein V2A77_02010 [Pseudomonadota bacterium]
MAEDKHGPKVVDLDAYRRLRHGSPDPAPTFGCGGNCLGCEETAARGLAELQRRVLRRLARGRLKDPFQGGCGKEK